MSFVPGESVCRAPTSPPTGSPRGSHSGIIYMSNEPVDHHPSTGNGVSESAAIVAADVAATADLATAIETITTEIVAPPSFDDLGLHPDVKLALDEMGYFQPTPVQTAVYRPVS